MNLRIFGTAYKGILDKEKIILVVNDVTDTSKYLLTDTTYDNKGRISNKHRHVFELPYLRVNKGDIIIIFTKKGERIRLRKEERVYHYLYWGLEETIWNKGKDKAYLYWIADSKSKDVS